MVSGNPERGPGGTPRYFTSCDAARIARNVVSDQGETPEAVLACIAKGLGYNVIAVRTQGTVVKSFAGSPAASILVVILKLLKLAVRRSPFFRNQFKTAIQTLEEFETSFETLLEEEYTQQFVDDVLLRSKKGCRCKDQPKFSNLIGGR